MNSDFDKTGWQNVKLGDICESVSETYNKNSKNVVLINTSDVLQGKILNNSFVVNKNLKGQFKKIFRRNDILFSEIRPINRRYAFVDFENTQDYIASTKLMVLRVNQEKILPKYFYYFITSEKILIELQHLAETRSGTFPQITFDSGLSTLEIKLPPLEIQKKIAAVLSALDDKRETNNAINKNLEQQAQAIFKSWFIDFEPFGGKMPDDWKIEVLENVSNLSAGGDKPQIFSKIESSDCVYPIYSNGISENGLYGYTDRAIINEESVTVSARGTIGFVCLRQTPYFPIVRLITLVPKNNLISAKYLYFYLKNSHIEGTGTTQQQLTIPIFGKSEILLPNYKLVRKFTDLINPMFEKILQNHQENKNLAEMRDLLLPRLLNGEIDVSAVEI